MEQLITLVGAVGGMSILVGIVSMVVVGFEVHWPLYLVLLGLFLIGVVSIVLFIDICLNS